MESLKYLMIELPQRQYPLPFVYGFCNGLALGLFVVLAIYSLVMR